MADKINVLDLAGKVRTGGKIARAASLATPIGAARTAATTLVNPRLDRAAKKYVERRRQQTGVQAEPEKKLTGISFWLIVGLAIVKDALDLFLNLTLVLILLVIPIGFLISLCVFIYFYFQGVKMDSRKIATIVIGFLIDVIPILSIFPTFTATIFIIRWLENSGDKKFLGVSVSKIAQMKV